MLRTTTLSVPCRKNYLAPVVEFVRTLAHDYGFTQADAALLGMAVEEAMANVIEHGYRGESDETMTLELREAPGCLEIAIHEQGMPFDPATLPDYTPGKDAPGLGLHLMRNAVNEVAFHNLGRKGKETLLVKRLPGGRIDELEPEGLGAPGTGRDARTAARAKPVPFTVRPPRPDEALAISRLAWSAYGYGYSDYIYHPQMFNEIIAQGKLSSWVAVSDATDEIMGHLAIKRESPNAPMPELGVAFVNPAFRGCGVYNTLNDACVLETRQSGAKGFCIQAVTSHLASQAAGRRHGMTPCALQLGILSDINFKGLESTGQRESLLTMVHAFDHSPRAINAPLRHRAMLETILGWQDLPRDFAPGGQPAPLAAHGSMRASILSDGLNSAVIKVTACGTGTRDEIMVRLDSFRRNKVDGIYLALPLDDPATPELCEACEAVGFFFAGMLPFGLDGRDFLQLQYLNLPTLDTDRLQMHSEESRSLMHYVLEQAHAAGAL